MKLMTLVPQLSQMTINFSLNNTRRHIVPPLHLPLYLGIPRATVMRCLLTRCFGALLKLLSALPCDADTVRWPSNYVFSASWQSLAGSMVPVREEMEA